MAASEGVRVVLVTAPPQHADELASVLVEERLIACANLLRGVASVYRWQGQVERAEEVLLVLKTTSERLPALQARVVEIHPYDVPEFLVLPVEQGLADYLAWVSRECDDA